MVNELKNYQVNILRARTGPCRTLTLELMESFDKMSHATLFFYEESPSDLGMANRDTGMLVVNLPLADFQPMYHVLQSEKPAFVNWRLEPGNDKIISFSLSTSREPLGEGFADNSP